MDLFAAVKDVIKNDRTTIQYATDDGESELIKIDATVNEGHGLSSTPTIHEVEDGSVISDHVIKNGRTLSLNGMVSDDPITIASAAVGNVAGSVGSLLPGFVGTAVTGAIAKIGNSLISEGKGKPSKNAFEVFETIYEERLPLTIITGLKTYTNMIMESLNISRTPQNARALEFTATFREIKIVESELVDIPEAFIDSSISASAAAKKSLGKINPKAIADKISSKGSSILASIAGGF